MKHSTIIRSLLVLPIALLAVFGGGSDTEAGGIAVLTCEVGNNFGVCEAGPELPGNTYAFTTTGRAFLPNPSAPTQPGVQFACLPTMSAGAVQVTVTFADGTSATSQRTVCPLPREDQPPRLPL